MKIIPLLILVFTLLACGNAGNSSELPANDTPAEVPVPVSESARADTQQADHVNSGTTEETENIHTDDPSDLAESADTAETDTAEQVQDRPTGRLRPGTTAFKPEFRNLINDDGRPTVMGKTTEEVDDLLGEPRALVRQTAANPEFTREVRVYMPYDEDPTGFYIYFRAGEVVEERLDEFNGLYGSAVLEWFKF